MTTEVMDFLYTMQTPHNNLSICKRFDDKDKALAKLDVGALKDGVLSVNPVDDIYSKIKKTNKEYRYLINIRHQHVA